MRIGHIVYVSPQPNWYFPTHDHQDALELSFLRSGAGIFYHGNGETAVKAGDLIVKNSGLIHAERSDSKSPMDQICIEIHDVIQDGLEINHLIPDTMSPVMDFSDHYDLLNSIFTFLSDYVHVEGYEEICLSLLETVISMVKSRIPHPSLHKPGERVKGLELMAEIKEYVDLHYKEKLVAKDIAELFYLSEGHLSRQFKAYTGHTLNNYIIDKKMGEARRLLIFSDMDIKEIALSCGYSDLQYFYHVFKRSAGVTPLQFRTDYRRKRGERD